MDVILTRRNVATWYIELCLEQNKKTELKEDTSVKNREERPVVIVFRRMNCMYRPDVAYLVVLYSLGRIRASPSQWPVRGLKLIVCGSEVSYYL